jgi:hypothetical protein
VVYQQLGPEGPVERTFPPIWKIFS